MTTIQEIKQRVSGYTKAERIQRLNELLNKEGDLTSPEGYEILEIRNYNP